MQDASNRRTHERFHAVHPCKLRNRRALLFTTAHTTDVSRSGALLRIDRNRTFEPGDTIDLYIAPKTESFLASDTARHATIRRVVPIDHHYQAVAVEFNATAEQAIPLAA